MPLILFFYGLFARQYVVFDVCIFKKQNKKDYYICVLSVPLSGSFDWTCLSDAIFRPGFFLLCSWLRWPTWKHCLLLWSVTSIFEYYTHSLSDNYKWTQLGQLIICKLLLESPRNFVTRLVNFFKIDDITSTDRFKGFCLFCFFNSRNARNSNQNQPWPDV